MDQPSSPSLSQQQALCFLATGSRLIPEPEANMPYPAAWNHLPPGCLASSSKLKPPNRSCFVPVMPSLRNSVGATEQPYGARGDRQLSWKLREGALCPAHPGPQFSSVTLSCLFATPWTVACQASLSITNSWRLLKLMSIELVMPFNHLILCRPLLLPSVFPSIRVFSNEPVLRIKVAKALKLSASASVLLMNIQD